MIRKQETEYEIGSDNVFADLELDEADELLTRAQLGAYCPPDPESEKAEAKGKSQAALYRPGRSVQAHERPIPLVCRRPPACIPQMPGAKGHDPGEPPPKGRAVPAGHVCFLNAPDQVLLHRSTYAKKEAPHYPR